METSGERLVRSVTRSTSAAAEDCGSSAVKIGSNFHSLAPVDPGWRRNLSKRFGLCSFAERPSLSDSRGAIGFLMATSAFANW